MSLCAFCVGYVPTSLPLIGKFKVLFLLYHTFVIFARGDIISV